MKASGSVPTMALMTSLRSSFRGKGHHLEKWWKTMENYDLWMVYGKTSVSSRKLVIGGWYAAVDMQNNMMNFTIPNRHPEILSDCKGELEFLQVLQG